MLTGPKGRIPVSISVQGGQEIPAIYLGQQDVQVHLPSIWALQCPPHLYKTPPDARSSVHYLSGRYPDNASIQGGLLHQVQLTVHLLESLGYIINRDKSQLDPSQEIQFLGFQVDARQMKFSLPEGKIQDIAQVCQGILAQGRLSIRQLSRLLGKLNAVSQPVLSAPVRYRQLQ